MATSEDHIQVLKNLRYGVLRTPKQLDALDAAIAALRPASEEELPAEIAHAMKGLGDTIHWHLSALEGKRANEMETKHEINC